MVLFIRKKRAWYLKVHIGQVFSGMSVICALTQGLALNKLIHT